MMDKRPYIKLLVAVLARAVMDLLSNRVADKASRQEARRWLTSPMDDAWSFIWICDQLDICPQRTLKSILEFKPITDYGAGEGFWVYTSSCLDTLVDNMLRPENKWILLH